MSFKIRRIARARDKRADMMLQEAIIQSDLPPLHAETHRPTSTDPILPSDIGAETPQGAQQRADMAENNAKSYTDAQVGIVEQNSRDYTDAQVGIVEQNSRDYTDAQVGIVEQNSKDYTDAQVGIVEQNSRDYTDNLKTYIEANYQPVIAFPTAGRPLDVPVGFMGFDTDLGLPIWWNGTDWIDASGNIV
jgi:hypothetical protein